MGRYFSLQQSREALKNILDENLPPVGRFRLLSRGLSPAHCLPECEHIAGDRSCVACGNCVDACPQVLKLQGALTASNNRTSMYLENTVGDSCIRCYSCIGSCPQVDRQLKNYAVRFRMAEKMVHWFLVAMYVTAAGSGIALNHFRALWSPEFVFFVGLIHRITGVGVLLSPILLAVYGRDQLLRILKRSFSWSRADIGWLKDAFRYIIGDRNVSLFQGEFNPGQKVGSMVLAGSFFILGISGIIQWAGTGYFSAGTVKTWTLVHIGYAVAVDICLGIHILRKTLRTVIRLRQLYDDNLSLKFAEEKRQTGERKAGHAVAATTQQVHLGG